MIARVNEVLIKYKAKCIIKKKVQNKRYLLQMCVNINSSCTGCELYKDCCNAIAYYGRNGKKHIQIIELINHVRIL